MKRAPSTPFVDIDLKIKKVWLEWLKNNQEMVIQDTRVHRADYPAASNPGKVYRETDKSLVYISNGVDWVYVVGTERGLVADQPAMFGVHDAGAEYHTTDTAERFHWTGSAWIEDYQFTDSATSTVTTLLRLVHLTSGTAAAGFGARALVELQDASGQRELASSLQTTWDTATSGSETSRWILQLRNLGAALADAFAVTMGFVVIAGSIFWKSGTAQLGQLLHANTGPRSYTFPDADGNMVYETAALTNDNFVLGGGGAKVKDAGYAVVPVAKGGTGATDASGALSNLGGLAGSGVGGHTVTLAKLTGGGATGSLTWNDSGLLTAYSDPT